MNNYMNKTYIRTYATFLLIFLLCSCTRLDRQRTGVSVYSEDFYGLISADEPQAVLVGKEILQYGGNAIDASVAMALTMSVSYPSRVSLTGGGVCQYFNPEEKEEPRVTTIDFLPRAKKESNLAIPSFLRGIFTLFAKGGSYKWQELVIPAENLARFGAPISRAFAKDLEQYYKNVNSPNDDVIKRFSNNNVLLKEGDLYKQVELSSVLTTLRTKGVGDFYSGALEKIIISSARAKGYKLNDNYLRSYLPKVQRSLAQKIENETLYTPLYEPFIKTKQKSYGTGFVVTDYSGKTVSCVLTNGALFGNKSLIKEAGLFFSTPLSSADKIANNIVVNEFSKEYRLAAAGFGRKVKESALQLSNYLAKDLEKANLQEMKKNQEKLDGQSRLNYSYCPKGARNYADLCDLANDKRSFGMAKYLGTGTRKAKIFESRKNKLLLEKKKEIKNDK